MIVMQIIDSRKGMKVLKRRITSPEAFLMLKSAKVGKLLSILAPLVMGPRVCHWKMARRISAKPRVAMAR